MTALLVIAGLVMVGSGVLALVRPGTMWALTQWRNQAQGLASERNATWEGMNRWGGVLSMTVGIACLIGGVASGFAAHAHDSQTALLDDISIDCAKDGITLSNVGNDALHVKLARPRTVAGDIENDDFDYGSRNVLMAPTAKGYVSLSVDPNDLEATLPQGKALHVPVTIPSGAHCDNGMGAPLPFGGTGCSAFELQLTIAAPGTKGKALWRYCRFPQ